MKGQRVCFIGCGTYQEGICTADEEGKVEIDVDTKDYRSVPLEHVVLYNHVFDVQVVYN